MPEEPEHTFLLKEGVWRAEGSFFDGVGTRIAVAGEAQIRHYPDRWVYEGALRTATSQPVEHRTTDRKVYPPLSARRPTICPYFRSPALVGRRTMSNS